MNDLQKELQELKAKVAELESRIVAEPVKWQPKGGKYYVECLSVTNVFDRETQEQAERAAVEMRRFNRLLALRDELCGDGESNWGEVNGEYYIYFYNEDGRWHADCDHPRYVTPYFTTQDLAHRACDMLNSGEVEL